MSISSNAVYLACGADILSTVIIRRSRRSVYSQPIGIGDSASKSRTRHINAVGISIGSVGASICRTVNRECRNVGNGASRCESMYGAGDAEIAL